MKMNKYYVIAVGIVILLICTNFVSSINNLDNKNNNMNSCEHLCYLFGSGPNCWLYEFYLNDGENLTCVCIGEGGGSNFQTGATWSNENMIYSCEYSTGIIYKIDPETCEWYSIGGGGVGLNSLAYDPYSEYIFACTYNNHLYKIDPETGEQITIGSINDVQGIIGMSFDSEGTLYGWDTGNDALWIIDIETAEATQVGYLGIDLNYAADGDFCKEDDILYITIYQASDSNYSTYLYECNKETGSCTLIDILPEGIDVTALLIPWDNIPENYPPYIPCDPIPSNGAENQSILLNLCWTSGDPDDDEVTYDIYFGNCSDPPLIENNWSDDCYEISSLQFNTTYYWRILARDEHNSTTFGPIWNFTTEINYPPNCATIPRPYDGEQNVPGNATLCWNGSDPNYGDELKYDVYFGPNSPPLMVIQGQTDNCYDPYGSGEMPLFQDFYWKIVTWDREGEFCEGEIWTFSTGPNCTKDPPVIDGPTQGRPNVEYTYNFYTLDEYNALFFVDWGDGSKIETLYPNTPDGQQAEANHSWDKKDIYNISAWTVDIYGAISDKGHLDVTIPREKEVFIRFLKLLSYRIPVLEVFLRLLSLKRLV
jgi:hypothetical protein